jgi:hypothetical protein
VRPILGAIAIYLCCSPAKANCAPCRDRWTRQIASHARRVVAKVEFHCGELFPRVGFIVTNLTGASRAVVRFYNKRGTAEQWIKEEASGEDDAAELPSVPSQ